MFIFNNLLVETMIHTKCINAFFYQHLSHFVCYLGFFIFNELGLSDINNLPAFSKSRHVQSTSMMPP